jgi:NAD+ synthase
LARYLGLPSELLNVRPTTDTFSLEQGQDEFYFALPYEKMDLALWARNHNIPASELSTALGVSLNVAELVYRDIDAKRRATRYMHARPELVEPITELPK